MALDAVVNEDKPFRGGRLQEQFRFDDALGGLLVGLGLA
jgi:hypothetical protein